MQRNFFQHQQSAQLIITNHMPAQQRIRMYSSHLDPKVQAAHVEILQAQTDRRVPLHEANRRIRLPSREGPAKIATESPGSGRGEVEFGRRGRAGAPGRPRTLTFLALNQSTSLRKKSLSWPKAKSSP
jgi:hypothetical protein